VIRRVISAEIINESVYDICGKNYCDQTIDFLLSDGRRVRSHWTNRNGYGFCSLSGQDDAKCEECYASQRITVSYKGRSYCAVEV